MKKLIRGIIFLIVYFALIVISPFIILIHWIETDKKLSDCIFEIYKDIINREFI